LPPICEKLREALDKFCAFASSLKVESVPGTLQHRAWFGIALLTAYEGWGQTGTRGKPDGRNDTTVRKWSKDNIGLEIRRMYEAGENLNYAAIAQEQVALLRAATRYFGSWRLAVEYAGLNYDDIRRYKSWSRDRILDRIHELHEKGEDLSWRHVSTQVDPQLAAAATKRKHFGSWRNAVTAAGLDYGAIRRYREWDEDTITRKVRELHEQGIDLNAKNMEEYDITLITAARRRFDSWDRALTAAGLDYKKIVLRAPFKRRAKNGAAAPVAKPAGRRKADRNGRAAKPAKVAA
jgi:hypothetical protein